MTENSEYVRFDWAIKRILRDKANKEVLEGLITVLLGEAVEITEILESEGNQAAREKLAYMSMTPKQRRAYEDYMISVHAARDAWETLRDESRAEGEAIGEEKARRENALKMKTDKMPVELIAKYTCLTAEEIEAL